MPEPPVYFAFTGGRQIGPLQFAELADLAARGVLQPGDLAWKSGTPEWVPASRLLAFPRKKSPSGVREAAAPPAAEEPAPVTEGPAVEPLAAAGPVFRRPSDAAAPGWPRVQLSAASDDPGLTLHETGGEEHPDEGPGRAGAPAEAGASLPQALPLARLADPALLGAPATWALVFFGLGPLFLSAIAEDPLLRVRLFHFGCGALWLAFFHAAFRPETASGRTVVSVFFGAVLYGVLYFALLASWPPVSTLAPFTAPGTSFGARLLACLLGPALVQEAGKAAVLLLVARTLGELTDGGRGLFHGLIAGAGFGLCASLAAGGPALPAEDLAPRGAEATVTLLYGGFLGAAIRAAAQPFLQAVWTAIAGAYLAQGLPRPGRPLAPGRLALGLALPVLLHGAYEALAPPPLAFLSALVAAAAAALFLALFRQAEETPVLTALD